jgi:hypothetical protein
MNTETIADRKLQRVGSWCGRKFGLRFRMAAAALQYCDSSSPGGADPGLLNAAEELRAEVRVQVANRMAAKVVHYIDVILSRLPLDHEDVGT